MKAVLRWKESSSWAQCECKKYNHAMSDCFVAGPAVSTVGQAVGGAMDTDTVAVATGVRACRSAAVKSLSRLDRFPAARTDDDAQSITLSLC